MPPHYRERSPLGSHWKRYVLPCFAIGALLLIHMTFLNVTSGGGGRNGQLTETATPTREVATQGGEAASVQSTAKPLPTISPHHGISMPIVNLPCFDKRPFISTLTVAKGAAGHVTRHRPAHIQKELDEINTFGFERYLVMAEKASNSESLTQEDVQRAENNWIEDLPAASTAAAKCDEIFAQQKGSDVEALALGILVYNQLKDAVQSSISDSAPMVVDIGCVVGEVFAMQHKASTVVCIHTSRSFSTKPTYADPPPNLFHLFTLPGEDLLNGEFKQFFDVCNFFTLVFMLGNLRRDLQQEPERLVEVLKKVLPSSALVYAAIDAEDNDNHFMSSRFTAGPIVTKSVEEEDAARIRALDADVKKPQGHAKATIPPPPPAVIEAMTDRVIASAFAESANKHFLVKEYVIGKSSRPCRKTWNAPFVQWARSQSVTFDHGKVSFLVKLQQKEGRKVDLKLRYIHPLQYLHSLNLDTLLGAGLSDSVRIKLLGEMIATPRYSDPLPHNWVIASGKVQRIDKVDAAYDAKVDESKGYWGHSTRGYLHLLTHHLCLPVNPDGSPSPFLRLEGDCAVHCAMCVDTCSYLPKGTICKDCSKCGTECIKPVALTLQSASLKLDIEHFAKVSGCQKTYSSMHAARKVWAKWEREDAAGMGQAGNNGGFAG